MNIPQDEVHDSQEIYNDLAEFIGERLERYCPRLIAVNLMKATIEMVRATGTQEKEFLNLCDIVWHCVEETAKMEKNNE